jgi:HlyD family secretion protein
VTAVEVHNMVSRIAAALRRAPRVDPEPRSVAGPGRLPPRAGDRGRRVSRRSVVVAGVVVLALAGMVMKGLAARGIRVETARVQRGTLRVTVSGTGKARVRERHVVSAPAAGYLQRIALLPGDQVREGQELAILDPSTPTPLDARSRRSQEARLEAARAAEVGARAALERARATERAAETDWARTQQLAQEGAVSAKDVEAAELERRSRVAEREMAEASLRQAREEVAAARALLASVAGTGSGAIVVRATAGGRVLRVVQESEGTVEAGTPLLEVGDLGDLEVAVDLLTTDAVRVAVGDQVELHHWGGQRALPGVVRRIDPSGFTKVSALGVEEQRVYVVVGPAAPGAWAKLADNYRVEAQFLVAELPRALLVPVSSLVRGQDGWGVYTVEGGRSHLRAVQLGEMGADAAEVKGGLSEDQRVIVYPGDQVRDGARVVVP